MSTPRAARRAPHPPARLGHPRRSEAGFSLLEVALSLVILLTVLVAVSSLLSTAFKVGTNSRLKTEAVGVATSALDAQVASGPTTLLTEVGDASLGTQRPAGGPGTFTLEREVAPYVPGSSACVSPASNSQALLKLTVWATWAQVSAGTQWWVNGATGSTGNVVAVSTLVSVPAAAFNTSDGNLLVKVLGAGGEGEQGVTVTATLNGASLSPVSTTTTGCVVFSNVTPGTWTVKVSRSGWIDSQDDWDAATSSAVAPSQTQVVSAGSSTTFSFSYDQSATVTAQYSLAQGTPPAGLNLPLSFYSANLAAGPYVTAGSPASLFPWSPGPSYYVVAGSCGSESDPDGGNPTGSVDGQPVALSEGNAASVTIPLTPVAVEVTYNGTAVAGATVSAAVPNADANCPAAGSPTAMPTIGLGTTGAVLDAAHVGPAHHAVLTSAPGRPRPGTPRRPRVALLTAWGGPTCQASVTLSSTPDPSASGQAVTLTSVVTNAGSPWTCWFFSGTPTGTVTFSDGGRTIGTAALDGSGTATISTSGLSLGSHAVSARYGGDSRYIGTTSPTVTQVVNSTTTTTTTSSTTTTTAAPTTTTTTSPTGGTIGLQSGLPFGTFVLGASYTVGSTTFTSQSPPTIVVAGSGVYLNGSATPLPAGSVITVAVS